MNAKHVKTIFGTTLLATAVIGGVLASPLSAMADAPSSPVSYSNGYLNNQGKVQVPVTFTCDKGKTYTMTFKLEQSLPSNATASGSIAVSGTCNGQQQSRDLLVTGATPKAPFGVGTGHGDLMFTATGDPGIHDNLSQTMTIEY